jgi:hypothetical protein
VDMVKEEMLTHPPTPVVPATLPSNAPPQRHTPMTGCSVNATHYRRANPHTPGEGRVLAKSFA